MSDAPQPKDTTVTRILGVLLAVGLMVIFINVTDMMGWHSVVGGILTGLSGAVMGALGTSVNARYTAAILGNAGVTNFVLGLVMFFIGNKAPIIG